MFAPNSQKHPANHSASWGRMWVDFIDVAGSEKPSDFTFESAEWLKLQPSGNPCLCLYGVSDCFFLMRTWVHSLGLNVLPWNLVETLETGETDGLDGSVPFSGGHCFALCLSRFPRLHGTQRAINLSLISFWETNPWFGFMYIARTVVHAQSGTSSGRPAFGRAHCKPPTAHKAGSSGRLGDALGDAYAAFNEGNHH